MDPDRGLVARCQNPDSDEFEAAFEALYHRYRDRVYSIAYRITGTAADAMDVVQETFSLVFRKIAGFRGESLFGTWLFRIVVNCAIDSNRQSHTGLQRRTSSLSSLPGVEQSTDETTSGPANAAEVGELGDHVHQTIQRLSPKLRAVLVLRYLEHMNYDEVCATLGLSMGTVKSRTARAHVALQKELAGTLEPFGYRADTAGNYSTKVNGPNGPEHGGSVQEGVA
jgi:RNA polymerase sigma-70 factor, ECF subfamily